MPFYEYEAVEDKEGCRYCRAGFEIMQRISDQPLATCPECGGKIRKVISAHSVGASKSGFDDRAKNAGFRKLKKLGKGEYEKQY